MISVLGLKFDAEWFDIGAFATGAIWATKQYFQRRAEARRVLSTSAPLLDMRAAIDYATGTSLFPFLLLALCPLSSDLLASLVQGQKTVLSVAGCIALVNFAKNT